MNAASGPFFGYRPCWERFVHGGRRVVCAIPTAPVYPEMAGALKWVRERYPAKVAAGVVYIRQIRTGILSRVPE